MDPQNTTDSVAKDSPVSTSSVSKDARNSQTSSPKDSKSSPNPTSQDFQTSIDPLPSDSHNSSDPINDTTKSFSAAHSDSLSTHVSVLHKGQVDALLDSLRRENVLSQEEHERCSSRPTRVERCQVMLEILKTKPGGIRALKTALECLPPHGVNQKDEETSLSLILNDSAYDTSEEILTERENKIAELEAEKEQLLKELAEKTEELTAIKAAKGDSTKGEEGNESEGTETADHRAKALNQRVDTGENKIYTMTYKRRESLERQVKEDIEKIRLLQEENMELKRELSSLSETITQKDREMKVVTELEDIYPYIKDALAGSVRHIPQSTRPVPVYCLDMKFDKAYTNTQFCHISCQGNLINTPDDVGSMQGYRKYQGTTGTIPIMLPLATSSLLPPPLHYWESHTIVNLDDRILSFPTLLEMGICEEGWVDKMSWVYKQPRSWCVRVGVCRTHRWGICTQVWGNQKQHGLCHPHAMSNTPNKTATLCYGIVVDVQRGRIAFLDLSKERVLHTLAMTFTQTLYPVFAVEPWVEKCYLNMEVMSGADNMTDNKINLIKNALHIA